MVIDEIITLINIKSVSMFYSNRRFYYQQPIYSELMDSEPFLTIFFYKDGNEVCQTGSRKYKLNDLPKRYLKHWDFLEKEFKKVDWEAVEVMDELTRGM